MFCLTDDYNCNIVMVWPRGIQLSVGLYPFMFKPPGGWQVRSQREDSWSSVTFRETCESSDGFAY